MVVATIAAIIASQATITATFCIIKQALAHDCFPRVRVVHTSEKFCDQIYIPDINWVLMILCIAVTAGFKNQVQIGNAYGEYFITIIVESICASWILPFPERKSHMLCFIFFFFFFGWVDFFFPSLCFGSGVLGVIDEHTLALKKIIRSLFR